MMTSTDERDSPARLWPLAILLLAGLAVGGSPALAQTAESMPLTPDQTRACLCDEQAMQTLRADTDARWKAYNEAVNRDKSLTQQIDSLRATMNPADLSAQDQIRELIDMRTRVRMQIHGTDLPTLRDETSRLNAHVASYNANCVNRPIYLGVQEEVRKNLVCPTP